MSEHKVKENLPDAVDKPDDAQETLTRILKDVIGNRNNLQEQVQTQLQQIEVGRAQLVKFNTLIATLEMTLGSTALLEMLQVREMETALSYAPDAQAPESDDPAV